MSYVVRTLLCDQKLLLVPAETAVSVVEFVFEHAFAGVAQWHFDVANRAVGDVESMKGKPTHGAGITVAIRLHLLLLLLFFLFFPLFPVFSIPFLRLRHALNIAMSKPVHELIAKHAEFILADVVLRGETKGWLMFAGPFCHKLPFKSSGRVFTCFL
jgi:hypothetical protein